MGWDKDCVMAGDPVQFIITEFDYKLYLYKNKIKASFLYSSHLGLSFCHIFIDLPVKYF